MSGSGLIGAIDIGGSKIEVGLADESGKLLAQARFATLPERGPALVIAETVAALKTLLRDIGGTLRAVGVGCVGPLDIAAGVIKNPPNFPGWHEVRLKALLGEALGVPIFIDNDANAAALAEFRLGAGRGASIMVYTTVSTGVGGGIVVNGQLLHGVGGGAGEFGHATIWPGGLPCACGNQGCLEMYASGTAIVKRAQEAIANGQGDTMRSLAQADGLPLHAGHVARAAYAGDDAARRIWTAAIEALALGLGNVISTVAPDCLVIGGGVSLTGELLLGPLREGLKRHVRMVPIDQVAVRVAAFSSSAGLYGAIAVGLSPSVETPATT